MDKRNNKKEEDEYRDLLKYIAGLLLPGGALCYYELGLRTTHGISSISSPIYDGQFLF